MKKTNYKISILAFLIGVLLPFGASIYASEVTGTLCTGLNCPVEGVIIASPVASPVAGTYTSAQSVALSAPGASSIHYTTDGTIPVCPTGTVYSSLISVSSSQTIKAITCYPNNQSSSVALFVYTINIPTPTPVPAPVSGGGGGGGGYIPTPTPTPQILGASIKKGDSNKDGKIDVLDFNTLMVNWGSTSANNLADLNGDGKVDILDFNLLMVNWSL